MIRSPILFFVLAAGLLALPALPGPVRALSIAGAPAPSGSGERVRGRVASTVSAYGADGVLRTEVVLVGVGGAETARFTVPGGRDGGDLWVVDGVPAFLPGETVEVALVPTALGVTVAAAGDAVVRLAPAADGRSGALFAEAGIDTALAPRIDSVDPELSGAAPDQKTIITLRGSRFGAVQGEARITFQGLFERTDAPVVAWSDTEIRCHVPVPGLLGTPQVLSGTVKVWTPAGGWSDGDPFVGGPRFRVLYQWAGDAWRSGNLPVGVYVNPDGFPWGAAAGPVVAAALERWNVPGSYARIEYRGLTQAEAGPHRASGPRSGDDRNTVRWRTPWAHNPAWLAVTWSRIDTLTFEREETDLEINGDHYVWSLDAEGELGAYDLPSTLAHEFGHWLRLGHTQSIASVMLPFFGAGELRRDLSVADNFGASWIYPSYGTIEAPAAIASGGALALRLRARDREGRERPGLLADRISVRLLPLLPGGPRPGPIDGPLEGEPAAVVGPDNGTDADGWTSATVPGLGDGLYRLEVFVDGSLVRPAPLVQVGEAPVIALYDVRGARVREVVSGRFDAGANEVPLWTRSAGGETLAPGVYFLRLSAVAGDTFAPLTSRLVVLP